MDPRENSDHQKQKENNQQQTKPCGRREFLKGAAKLAALGGTAMLAGCGTEALGSSEALKLRFQEFIKKNYRLMTPEEKDETVRRLERLAKMKRGVDVQMSQREPIEGVLFGYAFNVTRCEGYMECVAACVKENNLDRKSNTQYIRIFEMEHGEMTPEVGDGKYFHEVPVADHFYMGVQCFHCQNAPCVKACPTKATWMEPDGIVVVDYDWCIGCRYCIAACPYYGRRFNWNEPVVPINEMTKKQHYLGNRMRSRGQMEKCTFCVQRSREGRNPACVEACPTGARVFGNLLVTAFSYQGLPARPFWNNPLMGPRFLASAFAAGPALIIVVLIIIQSTTSFKIEDRIFNKIRRISVVSAIINLIMLFSEIFKEFYLPTHHSLPAIYLYFGLDGHNALVPWIWTAIAMNVLGTLTMAFNPGKNNPKFLVPACIFLFLGIWIEKGIGLIVPGLVPSPMGEVVDYAPSWVEICVTLGILALGIFVVTLLVKPALKIEQRFESYNRSEAG